ncbi:hypothetical protein Tco_0736793 [Tanacetum coccineum]
MSTGKQNSDEHHQESSIKIQHCSFFLRTMDIYGTVLAYFEGRRFKKEGSSYTGQEKLSLTQDYFITIFHLPQQMTIIKYIRANHHHFLDMVPFSKQNRAIHGAEDILLWEGLYYYLHHPTSSIPYPRFTKIIVSHYMTIFPEISRRARDMYHNLQDDDIMKNIFNSGRHKDKVGMQIPDWMITEEMKHTEHYRMYAEVFGLDVPLTQSQPTESTQGTHRTPSAPRSPTPKKDTTESSAPKRSTVIRFRLPERRSTRLTPPAPVPTVDKADEMILQDTLQVEDLRMFIDEVYFPRNDEPQIPALVYELKRSEKGKIVEESRNTQFPTPIRSPRTHTNLVSSDTEKLQELTGRYTYLFGHLKERFLSRKSFDKLADHLPEVMVESLPTIVDMHIKEQVKKQVPEQVRVSLPEQQYQLYLSMKNDPQLQQQDIAICLALQMKFENLQVPQNTCRPSVVRPRDQDGPHDDAHPEGENSTKRQKTSEYEAYVSGESSSGQVNEEERGPSTSGNQEQVDDYDFWTDSYASDDDEILTKQVSQDIMEEVSLAIDGAKLKKMANEMLRQRCTSGDEHQYHTDQMKNFLKSNIVWESRKEILVSPHPRKTTPLVQSCQRDPEAPALSLINQDLLYLKKGSSGPEKIVLSLHKTLAKNPHAKIFYLKKQKEPWKTKEEVPDYAEIGLLWSLSVFIRSSVIWERVHDFQLELKVINRKTISLRQQYLSQELKSTECSLSSMSPVLEGLKSYNNDVKYGYVQREITNDEVEYRKLFEEEIEVSQESVYTPNNEFKQVAVSYATGVLFRVICIGDDAIKATEAFSSVVMSAMFFGKVGQDGCCLSARCA